MAKFDIPSRVRYVDHTGWGASPGFPRLGFHVPRRARTHVIIHHTVVVDPDATPNLWDTENTVFGRMVQLQTIRPDLGLDVPYNFVIFLMDGNPASIYVCEGRGEDRAGAHTKGHNTLGIGIALEGNFELAFDIGPFVPLISRFLGWLKYDPNGPGYGPYQPMENLGQLAPAGRQVFGHRDFAATACPGNSVYTALAQLGFTHP